MRSKGAREDDGDLRQVSRIETDANIRTIITELNDSRILVRIIGGDLIAKSEMLDLTEKQISQSR